MELEAIKEAIKEAGHVGMAGNTEEGLLGEEFFGMVANVTPLLRFSADQKA